MILCQSVGTSCRDGSGQRGVCDHHARKTVRNNNNNNNNNISHAFSFIFIESARFTCRRLKPTTPTTPTTMEERLVVRRMLFLLYRSIGFYVKGGTNKIRLLFPSPSRLVLPLSHDDWIDDALFHRTQPSLSSYQQHSTAQRMHLIIDWLFIGAGDDQVLKLSLPLSCSQQQRQQQPSAMRCDACNTNH